MSELDKKVAHAMGFKSVNNCEQWGASMNEKEINKAFDEEYIKYRAAFPKDYDIPVLAQTAQDPVAWQLWVGADTPFNAPMGWHFYSTYDSLKSAEISARTINSYQQAPFAKIVPLYTAPPQRTWVGLTDEEVKDIVWNLPYEPSQEHIRAIEAKLKEKNT